MIGWLMRRMRPGSFAWLVLHELRLAMLARRRKALSTIAGALILLLWVGLGVLIALGLRGVTIPIVPEAFSIAAAGSVGVFTFMTTQALLASQQTLYESGDLDLLFSSPMRPRTIVSAKLVGIVATIAVTFAMLILPLVLPAAIWGHPQLFGIPALLAALALIAACLGLAVTLAIARVAGPRAARTVGQVIAALSGGAIFLATQLTNMSGEGQGVGRRSGWEILYRDIQESGFGTHGIGALPGRAAFGDPVAIALVLGSGVLLFAFTSAAMQTGFLASYRAGGMRLSPRRRAKGGIDRNFRASLFGSVFAKEFRLLARDPALAFQIVLRLIYLVPLFYLAMRHGSQLPLAPSLAFMSVVIAGQVVSSFAWLTVSAEDSPDLIKIAPVEKEAIDHAKLMAAMAMAAPLFLILPIAIATETIAGAAVALGFTALAGWLTGQLEVAHAVPAPRSTFRRRRGGSWVRGLLQFLISGLIGAVAGVAVFAVQRFV